MNILNEKKDDLKDSNLLTGSVPKRSFNKVIFGTSETRNQLSKMTPPSTAEEIMSCDTVEARGADRWILVFGKIIGQYLTQQDLNIAMKILEVANIESIQQEYLSSHHLYQIYCETYENIERELFENIIKILIGNSTRFPLQKKDSGMELTKLGLYLLLTYKKLKSETLAMRKYGEFDEVYILIENLRTTCHFGDYGMDVEVGYSLTYTLKKLVQKLQSKGDLLVKEPKLKKWMETIYDLIDKLIIFQGSKDFQEGNLKVHQKINITNQLIEAIREFLGILSKQFEYTVFDATRFLFDKPFHEMQNYVLENFKEFPKLFYQSDKAGIPVQFTMRLNRFYLKKALHNFFDKKKKLTFDVLPDTPTDSFQEKELDINKIQQEEIHSLKELLFERGNQLGPCLDYLVIQDHDPIRLLEKSIAFHLLAKEKRVQLDNDVEIIEDEINNIEEIWARFFNILKEVTL